MALIRILEVSRCHTFPLVSVIQGQLHGVIVPLCLVRGWPQALLLGRESLFLPGLLSGSEKGGSYSHKQGEPGDSFQREEDVPESHSVLQLLGEGKLCQTVLLSPK